MIRLVATDLDGTFWGPEMMVSECHAQAIDQLRRRGVIVLAATSRRLRVIRPCFQRAGLALPLVLVDGAIGIDLRSGYRLQQAAFTPGGAVAALSSFRDSGLDPCVYVEDPDIDVFVSETPSTCAAHIASLGPWSRVGDLDEVVSDRLVYAFSVLGVAREQLECTAALLLSIGAQVTLFPDLGYGGYGLTVNPPGITKWNGVKAYCRMEGIHAGEVLAVGDGDNDVPMLTRAGVAVAVKGGSARALAASDHVINPPDEHGWMSLLDLI